METSLGKIKDVFVGIKGSQLGIHFTFSGSGWGVQHSEATWNIEHTGYCEWVEEDRTDKYIYIMYYIRELLAQAKVSSVNDLVNVPVEVTFEDNTFKAFRILTEVL